MGVEANRRRRRITVVCGLIIANARSVLGLYNAFIIIMIVESVSFRGKRRKQAKTRYLSFVGIPEKIKSSNN